MDLGRGYFREIAPTEKQMIRLAAFLLFSISITIISRRSLASPGSHGFYRFFAWEAILALLLYNIPFWFHDPFKWYQLLSWLLLTTSIIPFVLGIRQLRVAGKPGAQNRDDPVLMNFEKTTQLVSDGVYRFIRHPLYSSLFLLNWGVFYKIPSLIGLILAVCATGFLIATAKADEGECIQVFGNAYIAYMNRTKMFIPFVF